jgi:hypothetical protein
MSDPILSLSTQLDPPETFEVDGESFDLLGLKHLSDEQEAKAQGLFARFQNISGQLEHSANDQVAQRLSKDLRKRRLDLIALMTTVPRDLVEKLPLPAQVKLFKAIMEDFTGGDEDAEAKPAD